MNQIICGDLLEKIPFLPDNSIDLVLTSPPYASQRKNLYKSINEEAYPVWCMDWMGALWHKLSPNGSVLIVIRTHLRQGAISDYVLKSRLLLREQGWIENEELIWFKRDAPPLGSLERPRRCFEQILWFSKSSKPYIDLYACGKETKKTTFAGSTRFGEAVVKKKNEFFKTKKSRVTDVFDVPISYIEKGIPHPAMYPTRLCENLILTFSKSGDTILDPFFGSGTTGMAAASLGREFIGIDASAEYCEIAKKRILLKFPTCTIFETM